MRVRHFGDNPGRLRMYMHVPPAGTSTEKKPLVVVIHGCTQQAPRIAEQSGWNELADHAGFFVLYVEQRVWNDRLHCFSWFMPGDIAPGQGEAGSVRNMVEHASTKWPVDKDRVFVYGVSSGGSLAAALLACYPDVFQAGGVVAGAAYRGVEGNTLGRRALESSEHISADTLAERVTALHPERKQWPRIIIVHGTDDDVMSVTEGDALARQWAALHRVDTVPSSTVMDYRDVSGVEQLLYGKAGRAAVTYYRFHGMGHKVPVQPGPPPERGGTETIMSPAMGLHSTYLMARGFGLVK